MSSKDKYLELNISITSSPQDQYYMPIFDGKAIPNIQMLSGPSVEYWGPIFYAHRPVLNQTGSIIYESNGIWMNAEPGNIVTREFIENKYSDDEVFVATEFFNPFDTFLVQGGQRIPYYTDFLISSDDGVYSDNLFGLDKGDDWTYFVWNGGSVDASFYYDTVYVFLEAVAAPTFAEEVVEYLGPKSNAAEAVKIAKSVQKAKSILGDALKLAGPEQSELNVIKAFKSAAKIIGVGLDIGLILDDLNENMKAAKGSPNEEMMRKLAVVNAAASFGDLALKVAFESGSAVFVAGVIQGLALTSVAAPILIGAAAGVAAMLIYQQISPYVKEFLTDAILTDMYNSGNAPPLSMIDSKDGGKTFVGTTSDNLFAVSSSSSKIFEKAGGGFDTVLSSGNFKLSDHIEGLYLSGKASTATGNNGNNLIVGNELNNVIKGLNGADDLLGGAGKDKIIGGLGADRLTGGAGNDTFVFSSIKESSAATKGRDIILDFSKGDKIDVSAIDANSKIAGNQNFTFIGSAAFKGNAGELRVEKSSAGSIVYGDVNGDRKADFSIKLDDWVALNSASFFL